MKFRVAHSFVRFGAGGKAVVLNVQNSENILEIRDLKSLIGEKKLLRLSNTLESFRGRDFFFINGFKSVLDVG